MAILYVCGFDHYGSAVGTHTDTVWNIGSGAYLGDGWSAAPQRVTNPFLTQCRGDFSIGVPTWGARSGTYALMRRGADLYAPGGSAGYTRSGSEGLRLPIPGATTTTRLIHMAFSISELPAFDRASGYICDFLDSAGLIRATLLVNTSGRLQLVNGAACTAGSSGNGALPTSLLVSASPVISPQTWYYLSIRVVTNAVNDNADIDVYIGDISAANKVLTGTAVAFSTTGNRNIDILSILPASNTGRGAGYPGDVTVAAVRDIVIADTTGTYNNALIGQCFVSSQGMRQEYVGGGWSANKRSNIGDGILDSNTNRTGLYCVDAAALEIGASSFTFESWVRFHALPTAGTEANLIAKWRTNDNNRSYRLVYYGSDNTIRWEISTNGIATTTIKQLPWLPITDHWYHVAVVRSAGQVLLFINGSQLGVPVADANTYFNGVGSLGIAARYDGTSTLPANVALNGWLDETRLTIGVARYTADFTPSTAKFGRDVGSDPSFASVVLLLGYDALSTADESSYGRTVSTAAPALTAIQPNDGSFSYQVLNERPPIDDTYIEAAQTFAEGTLTFDAVPLANETVTIGAETYKWVAALAAANDVLIGADIAACISNMVNAINAGPGSGTVYGTGTPANAQATASLFVTPQFTLRAITIGAGGNAIATTETMTQGYFKAATLTGGQDIPADSDFAIERLPNDVTGVLGVQVTTRQYKTDAGTSTIRVDLIGPAGGVGAGTAQNPDLNPSWARQVFEQDPDTVAGLTPSTIIGGRIRFKRTA